MKKGLDLLNGKHYSEWVDEAINRNSRAVYDWIQRNYNSPFPLWAMNLENFPSNRELMKAFVVDKLEKATSSADYLVNFLKSIPSK